MKYHIEENIRLSTNYQESSKVLVSVGLRWSMLPGSMLSKDIQAIPVRAGFASQA